MSKNVYQTYKAYVDYAIDEAIKAIKTYIDKQDEKEKMIMDIRVISATHLAIDFYERLPKSVQGNPVKETLDNKNPVYLDDIYAFRFLNNALKHNPTMQYFTEDTNTHMFGAANGRAYFSFPTNFSKDVIWCDLSHFKRANNSLDDALYERYSCLLYNSPTEVTFDCLKTSLDKLLQQAETTP